MIFVLTVLFGFLVGYCAKALLAHDVQDMIDNDYERTWEEEIRLKKNNERN